MTDNSISGSIGGSMQTPREERLATALHRAQNSLQQCSVGHDHLNKVCDEMIAYIGELEGRLGIATPTMPTASYNWRQYRQTGDSKWLMT